MAQLIKIHNQPHRHILLNLVQKIQQQSKTFTIEFAVANLEQQPYFYLTVSNNFNLKSLNELGIKYKILNNLPIIFNHTGTHLTRYLLAKSKAVFRPLNWENIFIKELGEGFSVQYQFSQNYKEGLNIRLVSSAENFYRASEILDSLTNFFKKDFKAITPKDSSESLVEYTYQKFNNSQKIILTNSQIINSLLLPLIVENSSLFQEIKTVVQGEVLLDESSLEYYATDASIFKMKPWAIVLPRDKRDLINLVKWVVCEKSKILNLKSEIFNRLSITCRGKATDQAGGAINDGIIVRFPKYLDKILEVGKDFINVEPGVLWSSINDQLSKINRFIPCYPASANFSTIGGGVANNCSGEKTVKYGSMKDYILSLKMILADGEEVEIKPFSQKEIEKKQMQQNLEGEIYRKISDLLVGNYNLIENSRLKVNKSSTGYWLHDALLEDGLDLTKIICGSQGTLGIITEIKLKTIPKPKVTGLLLASFSNLDDLGSVVLDLLQLRPSALEMIDTPKLTLFIEFDNEHLETIKDKISSAKNILKKNAVDLKESYDQMEQNKLWQIRRSAALVAETVSGKKKALPFIEDVTVYPSYLGEYLKSLYGIMKKYEVQFSVWGHAGNGNLHVQPLLDLSDIKDREKLFNIAQEIYTKVISLRGSISGEHNDGLMRSPFLKEEFGEEMYKIFEQVKNIFDPQNIFNPHKKVGVDLDFVKNHLRHEYEVDIEHEKKS